MKLNQIRRQTLYLAGNDGNATMRLQQSISSQEKASEINKSDVLV